MACWRPGSSPRTLFPPSPGAFCADADRGPLRPVPARLPYGRPLFQRPYVWSREAQWEPLWEDLCALAESHLTHSATEGHFLGAIVLQKRQTGFSPLESMTIIDGQQRLTTLQLLLHALATALTGRGLSEPARRVHRFTRNDVDLTASNPEDAFKVWPTNRDLEAYTAVMTAAPDQPLPAALRTSPLAQASSYFQTVIAHQACGPGRIFQPAEHPRDHPRPPPGVD